MNIVAITNHVIPVTTLSRSSYPHPYPDYDKIYVEKTGKFFNIRIKEHGNCYGQLM